MHLDLDDAAGFEAACVQGRELGFDGKTLIHPKTIETANRIFAPSAEEVEWSRRIIHAHAEASAQGKGVVTTSRILADLAKLKNASLALESGYLPSNADWQRRSAVS